MSERIYSDKIVEATNLKRSFGGGNNAIHVLRGVDFTASEGEMVALYGPSGSGKTTLLNLIGALDHPTGGELSVCGEDLARISEGARARLRRHRMGFIFQNYTLLSTYTAAENIDLALRLPGLGYFERRKRVEITLRAVGLSAWATHMPDQLSGGQQQRIAIARALALRPELILADEPTSGMDTRTSRRILSLFQGIAHTQDTCFVIVSHDPVVMDYVDTAYDLHDGRLLLRSRETNQEVHEETVP